MRLRVLSKRQKIMRRKTIEQIMFLMERLICIKDSHCIKVVFVVQKSIGFKPLEKQVNSNLIRKSRYACGKKLFLNLFYCSSGVSCALITRFNINNNITYSKSVWWYANSFIYQRSFIKTWMCVHVCKNFTLNVLKYKLRRLV